jgi:hypothetical protein
MSYSDPQYAARPFARVVQAVDFGTSTASSATGANTTPTVYLPKFFRRTQVNNVRMTVTTIPDAGSTALVASFKNGTSTFATVTLTTATLNEVLDGTLTAANAIFAADGQPTVVVTGTATASGDAQGAYHVDFELQELFA